MTNMADRFYLPRLQDPDVSGDTPPEFGDTQPMPHVSWGDFTAQEAPRYQGWELTNRPAMIPFLGEYTNRETGEKSGGFAWPSMITEPLEAGNRLFKPGGTFEQNPTPESSQDMMTELLTLYGGNSVGGMARGATRNALADAGSMGLKDYGTSAYKSLMHRGEPTTIGPNLTEAYSDLYALENKVDRLKNASSAMDSFLSNPHLANENPAPQPRDQAGIDRVNSTLGQFSQSEIDRAMRMEEIAQNTFGFGIEFLSPEEMKYVAAAADRVKPKFGVIDGDLLSDTGKPSLMGAALASEQTPKGITEEDYLRTTLGY